MAIGAIRDTMRSFTAHSNDKGAFGDRVDIDYPAIIDESDEVTVKISHVKVHAIVNMAAIPSQRALDEGGEKLAQEYKLKYVMLTRAKSELHICAEPKEGQSLEDVLFPAGVSPEAAAAAAAEVDVPSSPPSKKARGAEAMAVMAHSAEASRKEAVKALDHAVALALDTFQISSLPTTVAARA